jgi:hypothetical protein
MKIDLSQEQKIYLTDIKAWLLTNYPAVRKWGSKIQEYHIHKLPVPIRLFLIEAVIDSGEYITEDRPYLNSLKPIYKIIQEEKEKKLLLQKKLENMFPRKNTTFRATKPRSGTSGTIPLTVQGSSSMTYTIVYGIQ